MAFGAEVIFLQNRYIEIFSKISADCSERAKTLSEIGISENFVFRKLIKEGVIRKCSNERYFLDRDSAYKFKRSFRRFLPF